MKIDLHTHHHRCGHAHGTIEEYIQRGIELGLDIIGISDHCPNFSSDDDQPTPRLKMAKSEFPYYVAEVMELKDKYHGEIEVLLGIESDFIPGKTTFYHNVYNLYPFDYIIGSVHGIDRHSIFAKKEWERMDIRELEQIKSLYYHYVQQSAKSGAYQILGHIDALKVYVPDFNLLVPKVIDDTLQIIKQEGTVIEVNTSGGKREVGDWFPSIDILERIYHYGNEITLVLMRISSNSLMDTGMRLVAC